MNNTVLIVSIAFLLPVGLTILFVGWKGSARQSIANRLETLSGNEDREIAPVTAAEMSQQALPKAVELLSPVAGAERHQLQNKLIHAGLYGPRAMMLYL